MAVDQLTELVQPSPLVRGTFLGEEAVGRRRGARRTWSVSTFVVDLVTTTLAAGLTLLLAAILGISRAPLEWALAMPVIVLAVFRLRGSYARRLGTSLLDDLRLVLAATAIAAMAVTSLRVATSNDAYVAAQEIWQWILTAGLVGLGRVGLFVREDRLRRAGRLNRPTLIIGAGTVGRLVASRLRNRPELGLKPIGFLDKEPMDGDGELPVLGASWDLERVIEEHDVEHVILTFSTAPHHVLLRIARTCEELRVGVHLVPRLFESVTDRLTVDHLGGLPLISMHRSDPKGWQVALKYVLDRMIAAALLVVCAPVLALTAICALLTMGRPVVYAQPRVGQDGRRFTLLKLRSMRPQVDGVEEDDEERVTRSRQLPPEDCVRRAAPAFQRPQGRDEPDRAAAGAAGFVDVFERQVYRYDARHRVKSGITGWAQVHGIGASRTALADRVEWDNYYIENWSPWLDLKIALLTPLALVRFTQR